MQKTGEVCNTCRTFWVKQNLKPKTLKRLTGVTANGGHVVPACPHCDGEEIFKISKRKDNKGFEPA